MLDFNNKGLITTFVLGFGVITGVYLLSSSDVETSKVIFKKEDTVEKKLTSVKKEKVVETAIKQKLIAKSSKAKNESVKLKPHHLYVRSSEQIEKDVKQQKEIRRRFWKTKKVRDNHMKNLQLQKRINKTKGKENV